MLISLRQISLTAFLSRKNKPPIESLRQKNKHLRQMANPMDGLVESFPL